jgi:hypothetical protein
MREGNGHAKWTLPGGIGLGSSTSSLLKSQEAGRVSRRDAPAKEHPQAVTPQVTTMAMTAIRAIPAQKRSFDFKLPGLVRPAWRVELYLIGTIRKFILFLS